MESSTKEDTGRKNGRSKRQASNPLWVYGLGAGVTMLVLGLVAVLATYNPHPPKKDPVKPRELPPAVKIEWKPEPLPPIDTDPAKMTVTQPALAIMDTPPDRANAEALQKEYRGEFTTFPREPAKATVLRVSRLPDAGPQWFRTFPERRQDAGGRVHRH